MKRFLHVMLFVATIIAFGSALVLAEDMGSGTMEQGHGMGGMGQQRGMKGMSGMGMQRKMQELQQHEKMMEGIEDPQQMMTDMRKHMQMMTDMMADMTRQQGGATSGSGGMSEGMPEH